MRISVDGRCIRNNKVAFSNLCGIVWTGPNTLKPGQQETVRVAIYPNANHSPLQRNRNDSNSVQPVALPNFLN